MNRVFKPTVVKAPRYVSLLELDMDPKAEVYFVLNRNTLDRLAAGQKTATGLVRQILPKYLGSEATCLVGILDLDKEYNAAVADGVTLQLVDIHSKTF